MGEGIVSRFLTLARFETVSQCANGHSCHLERSERSWIFSYMRRKDFSPELILSEIEGARNDICDAVSLRERKDEGSVSPRHRFSKECKWIRIVANCSFQKTQGLASRRRVSNLVTLGIVA